MKCLIGAAALLLVIASLVNAETTKFGPANPFFASSTLPFHAPPFDKIKDTDYQPAVEAGMAEQIRNIQAITDNPQAPTFENTLVALEKSDELLRRAAMPFFQVVAANSNPTLLAARAELAPKLAAHQDAIYLNEKLFERIKGVYNQRRSLELNPQSLRLTEVVYNHFVHAGANLSVADKVQLKKINEQLATLGDDFDNRLLAATKAGALVTTDKTVLAGLSDSEIAAAAEAAKGRSLSGYVIPLQNTTMQPALGSLTNRATRETLFKNSWNRAERGDANDTRQLIAQIAHLRSQKAKLLSYPNFAAWTLEDQMAKTPETAVKFMGQLAPPAVARAAAEAQGIQALIDSQKGGFQLQPWDWDIYSEQVRKATYDLNEEQVKPYFELNNVLQNGVFFAANQLYGLTFKERMDIPVYAPGVRVFEVFNPDGSSLALFYSDYFKRDNKQGGAWMDEFVGASKLMGTKAAVLNVANFAPPAQGQPALLTSDDVKTMFHEFGHALHGMFFAMDYPTLEQVANDFAEFPSQFNEHWATYPSIFKNYAKHYKTGEPMPADLAGKSDKARTLNAGYDMTHVVAAAELDMQWHSLPASAPLQNPDTFEKDALVKINLWISYVPPRYRSSYFGHIWNGGYAAEYYAYLWTQMLKDDAFDWFVEHGGISRANGDRFREMVLSRGNGEDLAKMYEAWRGAPPNIQPMLRYAGLVAESSLK